MHITMLWRRTRTYITVQYGEKKVPHTEKKKVTHIEKKKSVFRNIALMWAYYY